MKGGENSMECKNCPMRLFKVKVYAMSKNNVKLYIEDAKISPTWMLQKDIDGVNAQFAANPNLENARYVEKTGTSRCAGYSDIDDDFKNGYLKSYSYYCNKSNYGRVVILEGEQSHSYKDNCNIEGKRIDTKEWRRLVRDYKDIDDNWY